MTIKSAPNPRGSGKGVLHWLVHKIYLPFSRAKCRLSFLWILITNHTKFDTEFERVFFHRVFTMTPQHCLETYFHNFFSNKSSLIGLIAINRDSAAHRQPKLTIWGFIPMNFSQKKRIQLAFFCSISSRRTCALICAICHIMCFYDLRHEKEVCTRKVLGFYIIWTVEYKFENFKDLYGSVRWSFSGLKYWRILK